jgi:hypothetical protein
MSHHPYSHLYRHYHAPRRRFSRIQKRRASWQANHYYAWLFRAIGARV